MGTKGTREEGGTRRNASLGHHYINGDRGSRSPEYEYEEEIVYGDEVTAVITERARMGWQVLYDIRKKTRKGLLKDPSFLRKAKLVFFRRADFPYKNRVMELERRYDSLKAQKSVYRPMDPFNVFLLFLLLLIPGLIYVIVKARKKAKIRAKNSELDDSMIAIIREIQSILKASDIPFLPDAEAALAPTSSINQPLVLRAGEETQFGEGKTQVSSLPNEWLSQQDKLGTAPSLMDDSQK